MSLLHIRKGRTAERYAHTHNVRGGDAGAGGSRGTRFSGVPRVIPTHLGSKLRRLRAINERGFLTNTMRNGIIIEGELGREFARHDALLLHDGELWWRRICNNLVVGPARVERWSGRFWLLVITDE
jgi:hypothetical protein